MKNQLAFPGVALAAALAAVTCFDPDYQAGIECSSTGECPSNLQCASDGRCYPEGEGPPDASVIDGSGGDDGGPPSDGGDTADADPPEPMLRGRISILEDTLIDKGGNIRLRGANVSLSFHDPTTADVKPLDLNNDGTPDSSLNGCAVTVFDVSANQAPPEPLDQGLFRVNGTGSGEFECLFEPNPLKSNGPMRYVCRSTSGTAAGQIPINSQAIPNGDGTVTYRFENADFAGTNYVGMLLGVDGYSNAEANGFFPIVRQIDNPGTDELVAFNPGLQIDAVVMAVGANYQTFVGERPLPVDATEPSGGFTTFLDNVQDIAIQGDANEFFSDGIQVGLQANGDGFALDANSDRLVSVPVDGSAVTFSCTDSCGETGGGTIDAFLVRMETTDADLTGQPFFGMPPAVSAFATVECVFPSIPSGGKQVTIPEAVMAEVLQTDPTRIRTRVANVAASIENNEVGTATVEVAVGHSLTGFTDVP